jgi:adenine-specific DNA-methyltransferase
MAKFNNERGTELIWQGKYDEKGRLNLPERVSWPFQTIETVNESKFDREKQRDLFYQKKEEKSWKNRLIWGDNKYIMSSLLEEFAGKIDLIYIDPPFATGADFSYKVDVGDSEVVKEPSMIEEIAYRDTWGKGMDSFLQMMYERLFIMKDLLSSNGSIYVHLDWHVSHFIKIIMDEIFDKQNFRNEIVWHYQTYQGQVKNYFPRKHDVIMFYIKTNNNIFNLLKDDNPEQTIDYTRWNQFLNENNEITGANYPKNDSRFNGYYNRFVKENHRKPGPDDVIFRIEGNTVDSVWNIKAVDPKNISERIGFPTQKPKALLERIIKASSNEEDLVADFFCGSGTAGAVAEKLGRRWIMADLSRFAIQTTRKRLLQIENCSPFIIQNLGKYERQYWYSTFGTEGINKRQEYINTILKFYKSQPVTGFQNIHGTKNNRVVNVGELDIPVTLTQLEEVVKECIISKQTKIDILGWEFEMGLDKEMQEIKKKSGVDARLLKIPKEVMDPKYEGKIDFYDLGVLDLEVSVINRNVEIQINKFYIPHLELVKEEEIREKIKSWSDFIDYWAIDFNYRDDTFHNEWQDFRTKKNPKINLRANSRDSAEDKTNYYQKPGKYKVLVKVLDIFGNDTTEIVEVEIK